MVWLLWARYLVLALFAVLAASLVRLQLSDGRER
jgi:hypothetical protein